MSSSVPSAGGLLLRFFRLSFFSCAFRRASFPFHAHCTYTAAKK